MSKASPTLTSENLYFRRLTAEDVTETYVEWLNDPRVNQYLEVRLSTQTLDICREFVDQMNLSPTQHLFGIFLRQNDKHIGNAKIGFINEHHKNAQVSLFLGDKDSWGKGYATETVRTISDFGFHQLGLFKLEAGCYEDNLASLRVFLRCGYVVEGFMKSHVVSNGKRKGCFWLGACADEQRK